MRSGKKKVRAGKGNTTVQGNTAGRRKRSGGKRTTLIVVYTVCAVIVCACLVYYWLNIRGNESAPESDVKGVTVTEKEEAEAVYASPAAISEDVDEKIAALKEEEIELAGKLIELSSNSEASLVLMGNIYRKYGDTAEAMKYWGQAVTVNPGRADVYDGMGAVALEKGEYREAIGYWEKAIKADVDYQGIHGNIAQALIKLGEYEKAAGHLHKEIANTPESVMSYYLLGQCSLQKKDYIEAKKYYLRAIDLQADHVNAHFGMFTVCSRLKEADEARKWQDLFSKYKAAEMKALKESNREFDDVVSVSRSLAETCSSAGALYRSTGDSVKAEEYLLKAARLDPDKSRYLLELASIYQGRKDFDKAMEAHKKVAEIDPGNAINHFNLGMLSMQAKDYAGAEGAFKKVVQLLPDVSNGYRGLCQVYLRNESKRPEAVKLAQKAVELEPSAVNYFTLSWACEMNGEHETSLAAIEQAVALEPANQKYRQIYETALKRK